MPAHVVGLGRMSAIPAQAAVQPAPEDLLERARALNAFRALAARDDPNAFMEYVMRDERTGAPIVQAPIHEAWQQMITDHPRALIWSAVESGKSSQLSVGRVLWELGRNPGLRCCIVSNTHGQAQKMCRAIARYIEESVELRRVFPRLVKALPWTSTELVVQRQHVSKDPSVQAAGVHGNVLGARLDLLVMDDMLDFENTRTPNLRQELMDWYRSTLVGRLTADARVVCVGTAWHPEDFLHQLAKSGAWVAKRFPVVDPDTGASRWPEAWPLSRIAAKREELGPLEFARQMLCVARDDSESRFKLEWIQRCLRRGDGKSLCYGLQRLPPGVRTYTGVDLAVQRHSAADSTVLFTIAVRPNGDREVLEISSGKWSGPEIVGRLVDVHKRFFSVCVVENNASQEFVLQFARGVSAIPMRAFTTGRNKANPEFGVESLAAEMANSKWIIPNNSGRVAPEVDAWITEMLYYDPRSHTGDRLMASWFAREGARLGAMRVEGGRIDVLSR